MFELGTQVNGRTVKGWKGGFVEKRGLPPLKVISPKRIVLSAILLCILNTIIKNYELDHPHHRGHI